MDGFPPPVTMGSLISTLSQMKSQMDFMDKFMVLYVPEYVQLKNYAIVTQQQTGMASVAPTASYPLSVSLFHDPRKGTPTAPPRKSKIRREQTLVKTTTSASSPAASLKRRGRKRKYPIPSENMATNVQNVKEASQCSENVITVSGTKRDPFSTADNKRKHEPSTDNHGSHGKTNVFRLDTLVAVAFAVKQMEEGNFTVVQGIPSDSVDSISQQNCCRTGEGQDPQPSLSQAHHHGYQTAGEQFQANIMHKIQSSSSSVLLSNEMPDLSESQQEGYNSIFESPPELELIV